MNAHLNGFPHATHLIMWDFKHHYKVAAAGMQLLLGCYCHHCWFGFTYCLTKLKLYSHTDYIITVPCSFFPVYVVKPIVFGLVPVVHFFSVFFFCFQNLTPVIRIYTFVVFKRVVALPIAQFWPLPVPLNGCSCRFVVEGSSALFCSGFLKREQPQVWMPCDWG